MRFEKKRTMIVNFRIQNFQAQPNTLDKSEKLVFASFNFKKGYSIMQLLIYTSARKNRKAKTIFSEFKLQKYRISFYNLG